MKKYFFIILFLFAGAVGHSQVRNIFQKQIDEKKQYDETIVDPDYGIKHFDRLNPKLGGDSSRNCHGYACQGWVEDFYKDGKLVHKGYYVDGQLKIYKNYYPDGTLERDFRNMDLTKSELTTYYPDGKVRSKGVYVEGTPLQYEQYYPNGQLEYTEEFHKRGEYIVAIKSFFEDGKPESVMVLTDPKKLLYTKTEYYVTGKPKEEGKLFFSEAVLDYQKMDKWLFYDEAGKLKQEIIYENGKPVKEVSF